MDRQKFIDALFARAKAEGFEAYEAFYSSGEQFNAEVFGGEIVDYSVSESGGLGFRAIINGKMGYASTEVLDEDAIDLLIDGVKNGAAVIENDDRQFIFEGSSEYASVDNYSESLAAVSAKDKIQFALDLEKITLSRDERIQRVGGCAVLTSSSECAIYNSKGLNVSHKSNLAGGYVVPIAQEGERVNTGMEICIKQEFSDLSAEAIANKAVKQALDGLNAIQPESRTCAIAFDSGAATSMLSVFSSIFSADAAQKGLSLLKGREGEKIAGDAVTIVDDPHLAHSGASTPFDGEGVATYKKNIVENGVLTTLLHNLKTAAKQGVATTANASRGSYAATVGVAPTNFYIVPSETTQDELLAAMNDGILITEVSGLHAGANQISGDFSLLAKGFLIENGKKGAAVEQITVAGNFFTMLSDVVAVASDLDFGMPGSSMFGSPTLWIKSLSVAGK